MPPAALVATEAKLAASVAPPPGTPETDPVMFLRAYSNYLAPQPGLFSSDSWTVGVIWLRNVLLNPLIPAPAVPALTAAINQLIADPAALKTIQCHNAAQTGVSDINRAGEAFSQAIREALS